jgi:hypothetical protein
VLEEILGFVGAQLKLLLLGSSFVLASSINNPRLSPVVGLWSNRATPLAAVWITPAASTYVPVEARVKVILESNFLEFAKSRLRLGRMLG